MKQHVSVKVDEISYKGIKLGGINVEAELEETAEEMDVEGGVVERIIDKIDEKVGFVKPLIERLLDAEVRREEAQADDVIRLIKDGKCHAARFHNLYIRKDAQDGNNKPNDDHTPSAPCPRPNNCNGQHRKK